MESGLGVECRTNPQKVGDSSSQLMQLYTIDVG